MNLGGLAGTTLVTCMQGPLVLTERKRLTEDVEKKYRLANRSIYGCVVVPRLLFGSAIGASALLPSWCMCGRYCAIHMEKTKPET